MKYLAEKLQKFINWYASLYYKEVDPHMKENFYKKYF